MPLRHALYLPPFGEPADPHVMVDLAVAAEGARFIEAGPRSTT